MPKPSVTIRKADDGSFVIEGSIPSYATGSDPYPPSEFITNTAPSIDKALSKAAKVLRKRPVNGKEL